MRFLFYKLALLVCLYSLSACSLLTTQPLQSWQKQNQQLVQISDWTIKARIALRSNGEAYTATLVWQQQDNRFDLTLYAMLGHTVAHLHQDNQIARLDMPDEVSRYGHDAASLLYEAIGWHLPIEHLKHWIRGMPSSNQEQITLNDDGFIYRLNQGPWQIKYSRYGLYQDFYLPEKISVQHPDLSLKIAINEWTLHQP